eukprot:scaffold8763_cov119-Isochrysis_galbana.AAC.3
MAALPSGLSVPERSQLSDVPTLTDCLLRSATAWRSSGNSDAAMGMCRLLEASAMALQQQVAEAKVQRGLAVASQTLAAELSLKCERLAQRTALPPTPAAAVAAAPADGAYADGNSDRTGAFRDPTTPSAVPSGWHPCSCGDGPGARQDSGYGELAGRGCAGVPDSSSVPRRHLAQAMAAMDVDVLGGGGGLLSPVPSTPLPAGAGGGAGAGQRQYRTWIPEEPSPAAAGPGCGDRRLEAGLMSMGESDAMSVEELVQKLKVGRASALPLAMTPSRR